MGRSSRVRQTSTRSWGERIRILCPREPQGEPARSRAEWGVSCAGSAGAARGAHRPSVRTTGPPRAKRSLAGERGFEPRIWA